MTARRVFGVLMTTLLVAGVFLLGIIFTQSSSSEISVRNAWAYPFPKSIVSSAYMVIENTGGQADQLIRVSTDIANASLHQTFMTDNIAQMQPVEALEIPAHQAVEIAPGGYHIMLNDAKEDLVEGKTIQITLFFSSGKQVVVDVPVGVPNDV